MAGSVKKTMPFLRFHPNPASPFLALFPAATTLTTAFAYSNAGVPTLLLSPIPTPVSPRCRFRLFQHRRPHAAATTFVVKPCAASSPTKTTANAG